MSNPREVQIGDNGHEGDPRDLPPGTMVWTYLRHSPGDNQSLEDQEAAVRKYVREKEWLLTGIFKDEGASGKSTRKREQFRYMAHLARQKPRPADLLIIWSFARFARKQDHAQFYRAEMRMNGWQILSMMEDTPPGPLSRIYEALIDWKNEQFLEDLSAETLRGMLFMAEQGYLPGGRPCKGYRIHKVEIGIRKNGDPRMGRKPEPDPDVVPLVVKAFEMKARGAPYTAISQETGLYGPKSSTWNHFFHNRAYIGEYEYQGQVFTDVYPPIISMELFEAVQRRLPKRKQSMQGRHHPRRKGSRYFLANLGVCAHCGGKMEGKRVHTYRYYVCAQRNEQVDLCPESSLIPADAVEEKILEALLHHVLTPDHLNELLHWTNKSLNSSLEELELRIGKTRKELEEARHLVDKLAWNFGTMETTSAAAARLLADQEARAERLAFELADLEREWANSRIEASQEKIERYAHRARTMIEQAEFYDLREICEQLCSRIVMSSDECRVELHFPAAQISATTVPIQNGRREAIAQPDRS